MYQVQNSFRFNESDCASPLKELCMKAWLILGSCLIQTRTLHIKYDSCPHQVGFDNVANLQKGVINTAQKQRIHFLASSSAGG